MNDKLRIWDASACPPSANIIRYPHARAPVVCHTGGLAQVWDMVRAEDCRDAEDTRVSGIIVAHAADQLLESPAIAVILADALDMPAHRDDLHVRPECPMDWDRTVWSDLHLRDDLHVSGSRVPAHVSRPGVSSLS